MPPIPHSRTSPSSPTRPRKVPHGFLSPPKPKPRPIEDLSVRELQDLHDKNARILSTPAPSTSAYVQRISAEQAAIEARLVELVGVDSIQKMLKRTRIDEGDNMNVDAGRQTPPPPMGQAIDAKRRALNNFSAKIPQRNGESSTFTFQEAMQIEQEAHALDMRRQQELMEKRRRRGMPVPGEILTRQEREARIWAFMNYKPTESDLEDDDEEDDDDPSTWFEDDQDDGRKEQDIVEPDYEDISNIIRIDEARIPHNPFEERDGD